MGVMAGLSLGDTALLLNLLPVPLLNVERVGSRLLMLPVLMLAGFYQFLGPDWTLVGAGLAVLLGVATLPGMFRGFAGGEVRKMILTRACVPSPGSWPQGAWRPC
jgi:hypothetical protein